MPGYLTKQESIAVKGVANLHIRSLFDNQQYADPHGLAAKMGISAATWPLFGLLWPSGTEMATRMALRPVNLAERILEIGCGLGLASLVGHRRGADMTASDCHPLAAQFLAENLRLNGLLPMKYRHGLWGRVDAVAGAGDGNETALALASATATATAIAVAAEMAMLTATANAWPRLSISARPVVPNLAVAQTALAPSNDGSVAVSGRFDLIMGSDILYERDDSGGLAHFIEEHAAASAEVWIVDPNRGNRPAFNRRMANLGFALTELRLDRVANPTQLAYKGRLLTYLRQGSVRA